MLAVSLDTAAWVVLAVLSLVLEGAGLAGLTVGGHRIRPLTWIVRGEMKRVPLFAVVLFLFLTWLLFHFFIEVPLARSTVIQGKRNHAAATMPTLPATSRNLSLQFYAKIASASEARWIATHYDNVTTNRFKLNGYQDEMRAANPNLRILVYENGMFAQKTEGTSYADSWYLRDSAGNKVRSKGYGNYLMNGRESGWIKHVEDECSADVAALGADGCWLDLLGDAPLSGGYNMDGLPPIDPLTGAVFTEADYWSMTTNVGKTVEADTGLPVQANGLGNGTRWDTSKVLAENLTFGGYAETWLRNSGASPSSFPSVSRWLEDMAIPQSIYPTVVCVKLWTGHTNAQEQQWRRFAYASYLLANSGNSSFEFTPDINTGWQDEAPIYNIDLGAPTGEMTELWSGAYARDYEGARVVVNPTDSPVKVWLPHKGRRILDAHDAAVAAR